MLKRTEVIAVRGTYQGSLLAILVNFQKFLEETFFRKSLAKSESGDRLQPEKILKITEYTSYSIRYCKILFTQLLREDWLFKRRFFYFSPGRG